MRRAGSDRRRHLLRQPYRLQAAAAALRRSGRHGLHFAAPYDSELGLTLVNAKWLVEQMGLPNVKFAPTGLPTISEMVGMAAQAVGDGVCSTCLVIYPTGNLEGRYRRGGENADDYARGARQWTAPWGNHGGNGHQHVPARSKSA